MTSGTGSAVVWGDGIGIGDAIAAALERTGSTVARGGEESGRGDVAALIAGVDGDLDLVVICTEGPDDAHPIAELSDEAWEAALERDLGLAFRGIRAALARMLPCEAGRIIVATRVEAKLPRAGASAYVAAQHGVGGLVKSVAHEVGRKGIAVNGLVCGVIENRGPADEDLLERSSLKRPVTPDEVAAAALVLAGPTHTSLTGTLFPVHGGSIAY